MASTTRKRPAKPAATVRATNVKLKVAGETTNTFKFEYSGTAAEPFTKALYITKDAIETLNDGPLTVIFTPYVPTGPKQKPMPASAIRYSGDPTTVRDLYVNRAAAEKKGFTEGGKASVVITVVSEDEISLAISPA